MDNKGFCVWLTRWRKEHPVPDGLVHRASSRVHTSWADDEVTLEMYQEGVRWMVRVIYIQRYGDEVVERWLPDVFATQEEAFTAGMAEAYGLAREDVIALLYGLMGIEQKWRFGHQVLTYMEVWQILLAVEPEWDRFLPTIKEILGRIQEYDMNLYKLARYRIVEPRRQARINALVRWAKLRD